MADTGRLDELKHKFDENPKRYFAPLANEYRKAGDAELAIELCRTYLPQQPNHMSGYIVYGQALHDAGQTEESAAVFKQALSLDPENIIALRNLGDISRNAGDNVGAMRWYGKVLELDPRNEEISAFLTSLSAPGTRAFGPPAATTPERQAPPTIRPEPAPDASAVRLEDIFSEPDMAQTPFSTEERAEPQPVELESEQVFEDVSSESFEVTEWPAATDASANPESVSTPVIEGPWHTSPEEPTAESAAEAMHWSDESEEERTPLRFAEFMPEEEAAFAPTPEELGQTEPTAAPDVAAEPAPVAHAAPEMASAAAEPAEAGQGEESAPAAAQAPEPPVAQQAPAAADRESSPFVTETMAALYLSQGLHGEALAIYRQLAIRRDDPALRRKITELEAASTQQAPRETVRAFFARIGARRPNEKVEIAAQHGSSLAALFGSALQDANDVSAAQRLSGAFGNPQSGASHS
ncbi:MAG: tetratricopeptide repeat protein [Gemmatimonadota bacterium]